MQGGRGVAVSDPEVGVNEQHSQDMGEVPRQGTAFSYFRADRLLITLQEAVQGLSVFWGQKQPVIAFL